MKKIEATLSQLIDKQPNNEYNIIIVFDAATDIEKLNLKKFNKLMKNILNATLTGKEIIQLSKNDAVISIERNSEIGIL